MKGAKEFDLDITQVFIVTMLRLLLKTAKRKNLEAEKMVIFWFSVFNRHSVWGVGNILDLLPTRFFFFFALINLPLCPHHRLTASAGTIRDGLSVCLCLCLFTNWNLGDLKNRPTLEGLSGSVRVCVLFHSTKCKRNIITSGSRCTQKGKSFLCVHLVPY